MFICVIYVEVERQSSVVNLLYLSVVVDLVFVEVYLLIHSVVLLFLSLLVFDRMFSIWLKLDS